MAKEGETVTKKPKKSAKKRSNSGVSKGSKPLVSKKTLLRRFGNNEFVCKEALKALVEEEFLPDPTTVLVGRSTKDLKSSTLLDISIKGNDPVVLPHVALALCSAEEQWLKKEEERKEKQRNNRSSSAKDASSDEEDESD